MNQFDKIAIPSGIQGSSSAVSSSEDEPPVSETKSRGDDNTPQKVADAKSNRLLREILAEKAYRVVKKSLYGWAVFLFFQGWFSAIGIPLFSDKVVLAVTTAVTLNVFAAFLGVIRGLFPAHKPSKE